ncbi:hypothetical protein RF11_04510 [Thelohanellus kitauei]|uniref:Uncharacterized protein n=1 Tax=Thelohanellus kitauei TaxID=669202 RepID=A0A0C2N193_THEKT|nr:hypothetical protein RF11_04510 [Thelohanellus kitauei]
MPKKDIISYNLHDILQNDVYEKNIQTRTTYLRETALKLLMVPGKKFEQYVAFFNLSMFYLKTLDIKKAIFPLKKQLEIVEANPNLFDFKHQFITRYAND